MNQIAEKSTTVEHGHNGTEPILDKKADAVNYGCSLTHAQCPQLELYSMFGR